MSSSLNNQNVLVTGGTGLVGSHVVEKLLSLGAKVFVLDIALKPKSYFDSRKFQEKTVLIMRDVRDLEGVKKIIAEKNISYIFHLAAQALVPLALKEPYETLDTNIMGTVAVLEAARKNKSVKGVVVASSDKAYGKDCKDAREDQKLEGDHPYDVSKSSADLITRAYYKTYGVPVAVSRFANIYGPGDLNFDRLVPGAMQAIINKQPLQIRSDGTFVRDYIFVKDVADGYVSLAENIAATAGQAFNFSANYNFSVIDFIKKIFGIVGWECEYRILNNQKNEIPFQSLNAEKAKKVLGWQPKRTLEQGILETFEWYNSYFKK